jgi:hypothetical protein
MTGLTVGQTYKLGFSIANEDNFNSPPPPPLAPPSSQTVSVSINGSPMGDFTAPADPNSVYWKTWIPESLSFVAVSGSEDLSFSSTTEFDVGLDNVQVSVPGPSRVLDCRALS